MYVYNIHEIQDIINKYFWKSSRYELDSSFMSHEWYVNDFTFTNPLAVITQWLNALEDRPDDNLTILSSMCYPSKFLYLLYRIKINISFSNHNIAYDIKLYKVAINSTYVDENALTAETYHYMNKEEVMLLFDTLVDIYNKKILKVVYNTERGSKTLYESSVTQLCAFNTNIKRMAVERISCGWRSYKARLQDRHRQRFIHCLHEILLMPPGGSTGLRRCIVGGKDYWDAKQRFEKQKTTVL